MSSIFYQSFLTTWQDIYPSYMLSYWCPQVERQFSETVLLEALSSSPSPIKKQNKINEVSGLKPADKNRMGIRTTICQILLVYTIWDFGNTLLLLLWKKNWGKRALLQGSKVRTGANTPHVSNITQICISSWLRGRREGQTPKDNEIKDWEVITLHY
jgi:hypothetical protein